MILRLSTLSVSLGGAHGLPWGKVKVACALTVHGWKPAGACNSVPLSPFADVDIIVTMGYPPASSAQSAAWAVTRGCDTDQRVVVMMPRPGSAVMSTMTWIQQSCV